MHGLAVKKHGTPEAIAGILGLDASEVKAVIAQLMEAKRVIEVQGKYLLTPPARMALDSDYSRLYADLRTNPQFKAGYEGFERINGALKQLITEWQTVTVAGERVPNDHSDKDYDRNIIDRLGELHERAETVLDQIASALPRMQSLSEQAARGAGEGRRRCRRLGQRCQDRKLSHAVVRVARRFAASDGARARGIGARSHDHSIRHMDAGPRRRRGAESRPDRRQSLVGRAHAGPRLERPAGLRGDDARLRHVSSHRGATGRARE